MSLNELTHEIAYKAHNLISSCKARILIISLFFSLFLVKLIMGRKSVASLPSPYYILRVDQIPSSVTLYQLLSRISSYSRHIVGIARTADYYGKRLGRTIFFYCTSIIDARFISQTFIDFVEDGRDAQACVIADSVLGRASLTHLTMENRFHQVPVTVHIKGLERQVEGSTCYLMQILPRFELNGTVTALRLNYDVRRRMTRTDGFVTFLHEREGRQFGGEYDPIEAEDHGRVISCLLSDNVPMIVQIPDSIIFVNGMCEWNEEAERVNQLILPRRAPIAHANSAEHNDRPVVSSSQAQIVRKPIVASVIVRPQQSADPIPSTSKSQALSTAKESVPASGNDITKKAAINGWLKTKNKTRQNQIDKLSTKAVHNKKKATGHNNVELIYDSSEDEVVMIKKTKNVKINPSQKVTTTMQQPAKEPITAPDSEDDSQLIIHEEVVLTEEDDEPTKNV